MVVSEQSSVAPTRCEHAPTILVVDDSVMLRMLACITIEFAGYKTQQAEDGIQAMEMLVASKPDLVLLDINMPRMDGYKLCSMIKGHPDTSSIPVILLSGKDGTFDKIRGKLAGCDDYISKPYQSQRLIETIGHHLPGIGRPGDVSAS